MPFLEQSAYHDRMNLFPVCGNDLYAQMKIRKYAPPVLMCPIDPENLPKIHNVTPDGYEQVRINSSPIANKHYLQVPDALFKKTVQNPVWRAHAGSRNGSPPLQPGPRTGQATNACGDLDFSGWFLDNIWAFIS